MPSLLAVLGFLYALAFALERPHAMPANDAGDCLAPRSNVARAFDTAHRCVSTAIPEAQDAFDDGLTLLYAFDPEEARRAFERAASADPTLAIAWWGVANTYAPNINTSYDPADQKRGRDTIARATALRAHASPAERALIDATTQRFAYVGAKDEALSAKAYRDAMFASV